MSGARPCVLLRQQECCTVVAKVCNPEPHTMDAYVLSHTHGVEGCKCLFRARGVPHYRQAGLESCSVKSYHAAMTVCKQAALQQCTDTC